MFRLNTLKKILSVISCGVMTVSLVSFTGTMEKPISAKTSSELVQTKEANNQKIEDLQNKMDSLSSKNSEDEEYQALLQDKIDTQNENIQIVNEEINRLKEDIGTKEDSITELEEKISNQEDDIDEGMDNFKKRLRAIYINGNESLASAVAGSSDFYDLLSKYELISQVANHDNKLVNDLKDNLKETAKDKVSLTKAKSELAQKQQEKEEKKDEMQDSLDKLSSDYEKTSESIESRKLEINAASEQKSELEDTNKDLEVEIASLQSVESEAAQASVDTASAAGISNGDAEVPTAPQTTTTVLTDENGNPITGTTTTTVIVETSQAAQTVVTNAPEEVTEAPETTKAPEATQAPETTQAQTQAQAVTTTVPVESTEAPTTKVTETTTATTTQAAEENSVWTWPAPASYTISSGFGTRWGSRHAGIDIAGGVQGTSAIAAKSGTVIKVVSGCSHNYPKKSSCGCGGGYGNYVVISHGNGYSTLYGHLASVNVSVGQKVQAGQVVGKIGSTGFSTGYHLHFEIRVNGVAVNPTKYLY